MIGNKGLDLTEGRISSLLVRFATPYLAATVVTVLYSVIGIFVIGRYTNSAVTSGVTIGAQITSLIVTIMSGIGTGGTVLIARCVGEKNSGAGIKATGSVFIVTIGMVVILTLALWFGCAPLVDLLKTQPGARDSAIQYIKLCVFGVPFNIGYGMFAAIFRGMGNSKAPSIVAAVSCAVNIALSFLLVVTFKLEAAGVAIAASAAQLVSFIHIAIWLYRHKLPFPFARNDLKSDGKSTKYIFLVGMPIVLQELLVTVSFMIITNRVNRISIEASAAVGVVSRVFNIAFVIPFSIGSAISAMTAQNLGANKRGRAIASLRWGILFALVIDVAVFILCQIIPETLTGLFSNDEIVIRGAASYLRTFSADLLFVTFVFCMNSYLCGCGKSAVAMIHGLAVTFCIRVPISIYITGLEGLTLDAMLIRLGMATPVATAFSLVFCVIYISWQERKYKKSLPGPAEVY